MAHKRQFTISTSRMLAGIRKMELKRGDVLVVDHEDTLHYLDGIGKVVDFTVPLVFIPKPRTIESLSRADLLNLLEQIDQQGMSPAAEAGGGVPL